MNRARQFWQLEKSIWVEAGRNVKRGWQWALIAAVVLLGLDFLLHRLDPVLAVWLKQNQSERWLPAARQLSEWGKLHLAPLIALVLLAAGALWRGRRRGVWAAAAGVHAGVVAGLLVNVIKWVVARPRPSAGLEDGFYWFRLGYDYSSFPSGHATHCLAVVAAVAVLAPRYAGALGVGAVLVMWSRWYLERHYVTDLVAGAGLGIAVGVVFGLAARTLWQQSGKPAENRAREVVG